uniref:Domain of unknown function DB domain-containing protein n=1 Tax=Plectus sambesii TaxID=2011161 RepID=A0A914XKD4_9BILA
MQNIPFLIRLILLGGIIVAVLGKHDDDHEEVNQREKRQSDAERFGALNRARPRIPRVPYDEYGSLIVEGEENEVRSQEIPLERRAYGLTQEHRRLLEQRLKSIVAQRQARDKKTLSRTRFSHHQSSKISFSLDPEPHVKDTTERLSKLKTTSSGFSKPRPHTAIDRFTGPPSQVTRDPSPLIDTWEETATPINVADLQLRTTAEPEIVEAPRVVRPVVFGTPNPYRVTRPQFGRRTTTPESTFTDRPFESRPNVPQTGGGNQRRTANEKLDLCCQKQGVAPTCQELCNFDRFTQGSVTSAFLNNKCPGQQLSQAFDCASSRADHTKCCTDVNVHLYNNGQCMAFCSVQNGIPPNPIQYLGCLPIFDTIKNCYRLHQEVS